MSIRCGFFQGLFGIVCAMTLLACSTDAARLSAQPAKKVRLEEEEPAPEKSKVPKSIEEIQPLENPARAPAPDGKFDIAREANKATNPFIRLFLSRIAIPYDELLPAQGVRAIKISLLPERQLPEGKFSYFELNNDLATGNRKELASTAGFGYRSYEEIVLDQVEQLLDPARAKKFVELSRDEIEELAVQVLQTTRRWHAAKVESKVRVGKEWEAVDDSLRKKTIALRRDQLKRAIDAKNWRRADDLSLELSNYVDDPAAKKDIYRLLLRKALEALRPERDEDYTALREALNQFENLASGLGEDVARAARRQLTAKASQLVELAKKQAESNQNASAFNLLKSAEALDPELPAIQELRTRLRDRVLYVAVPRLPERMSPATARTDTERWAVDLLFESLLQSVPDLEAGRRFRPVLAESLPGLAPLSRDFTLRKNARWAGDGGKVVDARDVFGTLELLQKSAYLPCAEGIEMLDAEHVRIDNPLHFRLTFRQGMLEPLNRTTFKIVPARYLKAAGKDIDDDLFARSPYGSGPYRYDGREQEGPEREVAVFRANPYYGQRAGKLGLPNIREIRLFVPRLSSIGSDIATGQLHLALDLSSADISRYRDDPLAAGQMNVLSPKLNRRIYMLAVNHRRLSLQNVDLRRGIAAAIDRESILNDVYRTDAASTSHQVLAGPFPLNCWATPVRARKPEAALFNKSLAGGLLGAAADRRSIKLSLIYPEDDPLAVRACGKMKDQIESASKKSPADAPPVEITLIGAAADQFHRKIEQEHDFELAYVPYDYSDDLYWLGNLFDRTAAGRGGRNFLGYLAAGANPQADDNALGASLDEIRAHRDFYGSVREETWKIHNKFLSRMPFVPLWQLDRFFVVHRNLEMVLDGASVKLGSDNIDPAAIFNGVETWRLR